VGPNGPLLQDRRFLVLLLACGVIMLVATTAISFSGAYFTSSSRSPDNEFVAGSVDLQLSQTGQVVNGDQMIPGDIRTGEQTVTNLAQAALLTLRPRDLDTRSPLAHVLDIKVRQTVPAKPDAPALYYGPLDEMGKVELGTLAEGESRTYSITVEWPARDDDRELQGSRTSLEFDWRLESVS
jgi:hypothetical protein